MSIQTPSQGKRTEDEGFVTTNQSTTLPSEFNSVTTYVTLAQFADTVGSVIADRYHYPNTKKQQVINALVKNFDIHGVDNDDVLGVLSREKLPLVDQDDKGLQPISPQ